MEKHFKKIGILILVYSLLVAVGGGVGFLLKKSSASLYMGSLSGLMLLYLSIKVMTLYRWALKVAILWILLLDLFFSYRYLLSFQIVPAGVMLLLTTATLATILLQLKKLEGVRAK